MRWLDRILTRGRHHRELSAIARRRLLLACRELSDQERTVREEMGLAVSPRLSLIDEEMGVVISPQMREEITQD
ncbi:hypothetical protein [Telmatospirillum sp. J64-1]|uniref:hypothetical protein n=1 Tax=Telmatospirillum sp. J64-1 TaxID=2502183 RepID=UPI00115F3689|nr:hypothetical protein [Telmatospirillum sp. J64-1]